MQQPGARFCAAPVLPCILTGNQLKRKAGYLHRPPAGVRAACDYGAATRNTVQSPSNDTTTRRQLAAILNYVSGCCVPALIRLLVVVPACLLAWLAHPTSGCRSLTLRLLQCFSS